MMQYTYDIVPEDFVALNIYFAENDPVVKKSFQKLRVGATTLVFFGGLIFMLALNMFTPFAVVVYGIAAGLVYKFLPKQLNRNMRKNVERTLKAASSKAICGPKTFTMEEKTCSLVGEEEHSTYEYGAFSKVVEDKAHVYLFLDDVSALILPFRAFADEAARSAFLSGISAKIEAAKAAKTPETTVDKPADGV